MTTPDSLENLQRRRNALQGEPCSEVELFLLAAADFLIALAILEQQREKVPKLGKPEPEAV